MHRYIGMGLREIYLICLFKSIGTWVAIYVQLTISWSRRNGNDFKGGRTCFAACWRFSMMDVDDDMAMFLGCICADGVGLLCWLHFWGMEVGGEGNVEM